MGFGEADTNLGDLNDCCCCCGIESFSLAKDSDLFLPTKEPDEAECTNPELLDPPGRPIRLASPTTLPPPPTRTTGRPDSRPPVGAASFVSVGAGGFKHAINAENNCGSDKMAVMAGSSDGVGQGLPALARLWVKTHTTFCEMGFSRFKGFLIKIPINFLYSICRSLWIRIRYWIE